MTATREQTEKHNNLVGRVNGWNRLSDVRKSMVPGHKDELIAQTQAANLYATDHNTTVGRIAGISQEKLRNHVSSKESQARADTVKYLIENLDDIVEGASDDKLKKAVYDSLDDVGLKPIALRDDPRGCNAFYNEAVQNYASYLNMKNLVSRFEKGETKEGDKRDILELAANMAMAEKQDKMINEEGRDRHSPWDQDAIVGASYVAGQAVYDVESHRDLIKYAKKALQNQKGAFENWLGEKNYSIEQFSKDLLRVNAYARPEETTQAIGKIATL